MIGEGARGELARGELLSVSGEIAATVKTVAITAYNATIGKGVPAAVKSVAITVYNATVTATPIGGGRTGGLICNVGTLLNR